MSQEKSKEETCASWDPPFLGSKHPTALPARRAFHPPIVLLLTRADNSVLLSATVGFFPSLNSKKCLRRSQATCLLGWYNMLCLIGLMCLDGNAVQQNASSRNTSTASRLRHPELSGANSSSCKLLTADDHCVLLIFPTETRERGGLNWDFSKVAENLELWLKSVSLQCRRGCTRVN